MVSTVNQRDLEVDHREAGQRARIHHRLDAFFDAGDVFLRHRTAHNLGFERIANARLCRRDHQFDARELAGTTGLLLVSLFVFNRSK